MTCERFGETLNRMAHARPRKYAISLRRMPFLTYLFCTVVVITHFLLCLPAMTCRMESDLGHVWLTISPYMSYLALVFVPLFDDRPRVVLPAAAFTVFLMVFCNCVGWENLSSARPHIGWTHGLGELVSSTFLSITLRFTLLVPIATVGVFISTALLIEYWSRRRIFRERDTTD